MALQAIPVWTVPPDWTDNVTEGLEWLTTVLASVTGVEQRSSIRLSPRRYLEFTVRAIKEWRNYLDALLSTEAQSQFYMPVWYEQAYLSAGASAGTNTISIVGPRTELNAAGVVMLRGGEPWLFELAEVTSVTQSGTISTFHLSANLQSNWPKNSKVYPVAVVQLADQPRYNRLSSAIAEMTVRMNFVQTNDWAPTVSLPTYRSFSVVEFPTNDGDTNTGSYFRMNATLDNTIGLPVRRDIAGIGFPGFGAANFVTMRKATDDLRTLLYFFRGKCAAAWLVNPTEDFRPKNGFASADTSITVLRSGYAELNGPTTGRQDIRVRLKDGSALYRRITSAVLNGDGTTETLGLDAAIGSNIALSAIDRISFMALGRLDQDLIELVHTTDNDGVCNVTLATKNVPDLRTGADWDPPALTLTNFGDCGPTVPGQWWGRVNDGLWNNTVGSNPSFGFLGIDISGITPPYFPLGQIDANFDVPNNNFLTFNFGATAFRYPMPHGALAWDVTPGGTTLNPSDANANLTLANFNLSMGRAMPSSAAGPGDNDNAARATTSTATQNGLRYFEIYTDALHPPRGWSGGIGNAAAGLSDFSNGGAGGSIDHNKMIIGNSAPTANFASSIAAGDTIGICVYT